MRFITTFLIILLSILTGCKNENDKNKIYNLHGYSVMADGKYYDCLSYEIEDIKSGEGTLLGAVASIQVNFKIRIKMFSDPNGYNMMYDLMCTNFFVERKWLVSKDRFYLIK